MNSPSEDYAEQEQRSVIDLKEQRKSRRGAGYFDMSSESAPPVPSLGQKGSNGELNVSKEDGKGSTERSSGSRSPRGGSVKRMSSLGSGENGSPTSGQTSPAPSLSRQNSGETAIQQFPLNDIDYESSPAAVAQELSNLQAIRRMSMNVDSGDPDLPGFGAGFGSVPTVAPTGSEDENDASRLFWVPARLHPELAPKEFKTFIEDKVDRIRRRSGDSDSLSVDGLERSGSGSSSLRRKKSMLSHQVDPKGSYEDGAERLERKRSRKSPVGGEAQVDLSELENLVSDPAQLMRRMSLDTVRKSQDSGVEVPASEDMPILPPVGQSLKRSTRTTYRRGSLKKGERVPFSRRAQQRRNSEAEEPPLPHSATLPSGAPEEPPALGLTRVQTEPTPPPPASSRSRDEYPERKDSASNRRRAGPGVSRSSEDLTEGGAQQRESREEDRSPRPSTEEQMQGQRPQQRQFHSRLASGPGRTTAQLPGYNNTNPLPHIVETLPDGTKVPVQSLVQQIPERKSSHELPRPFQRGGAHMRPVPGREHQRSQTLDDISSHPSPLPGGYNSRTDALTMVPTFDEKVEKKDASRKSSWKWLGIGNDDEKKAKERDYRDSDSASVKSAKSTKLLKTQPAEKARLDVLQNSIDGSASSRGRESLVLNREDVKLEDERRKEGKRASEGRKERDKDSGGLLSAIFSSKKKTSDGDLHSKSNKKEKRSSDRKASPSPEPMRILKPDIDYNWTRFSILEERAIYRMAHIKLANPRRALYSQVLLSNFMYSYLAKVQMMHPQVQIPPAHQKNGRGGGGEKKDEQPAEYSQYQRWQQVSDHPFCDRDHRLLTYVTLQQQERQDRESQTPSNGSATAAAAGSYAEPSQQQRSGFDTTSDEDSGGYDTRSSEEYDYEDQARHQQSYHHQQQSYQNQQQGYGRQNGGYYGSSGGPVGGDRGAGAGGGYSVSGSRDYLGYPKDQQPFDSRGLWDDERRDEELW